MTPPLLVMALLLMGIVPPFLNGLAVFAHKHALALAHASGGGKCKRRVPYPKGARRAVCTSEARKIRVPLARARGRASQEGLVSLLGAGAHDCFWGVEGCPRSGG